MRILAVQSEYEIAHNSVFMRSLTLVLVIEELRQAFFLYFVYLVHVKPTAA